MILRQIRTQLIIIIFCFLLLVLGSFTASFFYIQDHDAEETAQEIIHNHRISIQRLTWLSYTEPENTSIPQLRIEFENNLDLMVSQGLLNDVEGNLFSLPNNVDDLIRSEYNSITQLWPDYVSQLEILQAQPVNNPERIESWLALQALERQIVKGIDLAANAYDNYIIEQHKQIKFSLIVFIVITIPLVILGIYVIGNKIVTPIKLLNQSANQIKKGDLLQPVIAISEDEIGQLAHSMEAMRIQIAANKQILEEKIAERTHELTVATKFSQEISRKMNEEEIIRSAIHQAKNMLNVNEVSFCLLSEEGNCLQMIANGSGLISGKKVEQTLINGFELFHSNTQINNVADSHCEFLQSDKDGTYLSSMLKVGEKIIGEMCVQRDKSQSFDENEKKAFSLLTNSAAIAIYNNRLIEISKNQAKQSARLAERQHLAAELHDDLAQNLGASKMQIGQIINSLSEKKDQQNIEALEKLKTNLDIANEQVREVINGLSTNQKNKLEGLKEEIATAIADFQDICEIPVILRASDSSWENASFLIQRQLLLILRESLVNIRRHASAKEVQVNIFRNQNHLILNIKDDGDGFNLDQVSQDRHFGLKIMHARAERSGGNLKIQSEPGVGTWLEAIFPLETASQDRHEIGEENL